MDVLEFAPVSIAATDSEVMAVLRFRMASKATGREAAMHLHHDWRLRDGKVDYHRGTEDTARTVAALAS
jgi:ketosteroid isomerase-like protein